MDDFSMILQNHLAAEIVTLLALDYCDEAELRAAYKVAEQKLLDSADKVSLRFCSGWKRGSLL